MNTDDARNQTIETSESANAQPQNPGKNVYLINHEITGFIFVHVLDSVIAVRHNVGHLT